MAVQISAPACPQRCFLSHVKGILKDDKSYRIGSSLRLMGVAVSLETNSPGDANSSMSAAALQAPNELDSDCGDGALVLDDGTALVSLTVPSFMLGRLKSVNSFLGMTVDCIVLITAARDLCVDQVSIVQDVHAEVLRWFELSFQQQQQKENSGTTNPKQNYSTDWGYPTRAVSRDDLYEMIQMDCLSSDDDKGNIGISLDDLAALFDLDHDTAEEMIEELQVSGHIYRNQEGLYLPL